AAGTGRLVETGENIVHYLEKHVESISGAGRFLNYYLDTAVTILGKYIDLCRAEIPGDELKNVTDQTASAVDTLNDAFSRQYSRLLTGDMMDIESDIDVLKHMSESDNGNALSNADQEGSEGK
ncbi:MAG: 5-bromo-4-chloroindolyl phosphate hydrolysis family protein, partial [Candidatus Weimeria sp.]